MASTMTVRAVLPSGGGPVITSGAGGPGQLPVQLFEQGSRPAARHATLVQTPHVYTSLNTIAVLVQLYDEFGNSDVSSADLHVTATLDGAPPQSITLASYLMAGIGRTRRYAASVPTSWLNAASPAGSVAEVRTVLHGRDTQQGTFIVYGTPTWLGVRRPTAGIAGYMTADDGGVRAAAAMRAGDTFYLQMYAHTGGGPMDSFEVKLVVDPTVCELLPASGGSFTASYTGDVQGQMDGSYSTELLKRYHVDGSYFTKYQRLVRLSQLTSAFGHLGWVRLRVVGNGECLTSATITAFYAAGSTSYVPGVAQDDPLTLHGNTLNLYVDAPVGVLGELRTKAPVLNMAALNGGNATVDTHALLFHSPDSLVSSLVATVSVGDGAADGLVNATVRGQATFFHARRPSLPLVDTMIPVRARACNARAAT